MKVYRAEGRQAFVSVRQLAESAGKIRVNTPRLALG